MERNGTAQERARARTLLGIRLLHTLVWAFFASGILALPVLGAMRRFRMAWMVAGMILIECAVLVANGWRCPMTNWAARYGKEERPNFDIFLPQWLARHNKTIFGILFILNGIILLVQYFGWRIQ